MSAAWPSHKSTPHQKHSLITDGPNSSLDHENDEEEDDDDAETPEANAGALSKWNAPVPNLNPTHAQTAPRPAGSSVTTSRRRRVTRGHKSTTLTPQGLGQIIAAPPVTGAPINNHQIVSNSMRQVIGYAPPNPQCSQSVPVVNNYYFYQQDNRQVHQYQVLNAENDTARVTQRIRTLEKLLEAERQKRKEGNDWEVKCSSLQTEICRLNKNIESWHAAYSDLKTTFSQQNETLEQWQSKCSNLQATIDRRNDTLDQWQEWHKDRKAKIESLAKTKAETEAALESLRDDQANQFKEIDELKAEQSIRLLEVCKLKDEHASGLKDIAELKDKQASHLKEMQRLGVKQANQLREIEQLKNEEADRSEEIQKLKDEKANQLMEIQTLKNGQASQVTLNKKLTDEARQRTTKHKESLWSWGQKYNDMHTRSAVMQDELGKSHTSLVEVRAALAEEEQRAFILRSHNEMLEEQLWGIIGVTMSGLA